MNHGGHGYNRSSNTDSTFLGYPTRRYDIAPDGQRFYAIQAAAPLPPPVVTHINLIQNWIEELKQRVPTR